MASSRPSRDETPSRGCHLPPSHLGVPPTQIKLLSSPTVPFPAAVTPLGTGYVGTGWGVMLMEEGPLVGSRVSPPRMGLASPKSHGHCQLPGASFWHCPYAGSCPLGTETAPQEQRVPWELMPAVGSPWGARGAQTQGTIGPLWGGENRGVHLQGPPEPGLQP